ncbi:MAG: amidohydrolase [Emcibacter sp.]|nr:amidohydrolase [Emcibacter sp.]
MMKKYLLLAVFLLGLGSTYIINEIRSNTTETLVTSLDVNPSTYKPIAFVPVVIRGVTLLDGVGGQAQNVDILLERGQIKLIGEGIDAPQSSMEIDGTGRYITPGLIDVHTHLGTASLPYTTGDVSNWDVNEATNAMTPHVRAEHAISPQDPSLFAALAGGVTTFQVLPGSSNLVGGLGVVMKNVPAPTPQAMKFPDAPYGLKMACGENPKSYGEQDKAPGSRMGNVALQRQAWIDAKTYDADYRAGKRSRDLGLETLAAALKGDVNIHIHCYRADDMATMIDMAHEFGFQITAFHHAVEAYKIPDLLRENDICSVVWSDWWGFKLEALDGIQENAAFLEAAKACVVIHSDLPVIGQMLVVETAKALAAGRRAGLSLSTAEALRWVTINPAKLLGIADKVGSLEVGKNADVVLWSGDPFSIYSRVDQVFIDGAVVYDRHDPDHIPVSDMLTGQSALEGRL